MEQDIKADKGWLLVSTTGGLVWFGLVSLFNGISNFVGYSMPKPSLYKDRIGII